MEAQQQRKLGVLLGYFSIAIRNILGLLLIPFIIHHVGVEQYGVYSLVSSIILYLIILEMGLANTAIRFLSKYQATGDFTGQARFIGLMLIIYSVVTLVAMLVGGLLYQQLPAIFSHSMSVEEISLLQQTFLILMVNIAITLMSNTFTGVITAKEKFVFETGSQIVLFLLRCTVVVLVLYRGGDIVDIVIIDTLINLTQLIVRLFFVFGRLKIQVSFEGINKDLIKEVFGYTLFIGLNVIVNQINWRVDNFIIGVMVSSAAVAVYNIGNQLILSFIAFASAISNVFVPKIVKMVTLDESLSRVTDELIRIARMQMMVLGFVLSAFVVFGPLFIELFVGQDFKQAYYVALLPMLPFIFVLAQSSTNAVLQAMNKHKVRSLILLATALMNIVLSIILVDLYGLLGAALGTMITLLLGELIGVGIYLSRVIGLEMKRFYRQGFGFIIPTLLVVIGFGSFVESYFTRTWFGLISGVFSLLVVYLALVLLVAVNSTERRIIFSIFQRVK
ncbi:oligosaccharide flippase family protein [Thalassotalea sp. LPB0316]|uniref:oligosaccharide flippase family protein n=1 Tax=Thalassotalea sp. LPB0316 TaxID=2769490 RepID=UPI0018666656|nr:oligosaccharide flippase family protein [Thalassotalea sp. LPB0316]QOL26575.1 oligosaccharide flippase family protein [Thalassotalea sp. LPB0316]